MEIYFCNCFVELTEDNSEFRELFSAQNSALNFHKSKPVHFGYKSGNRVNRGLGFKIPFFMLIKKGDYEYNCIYIYKVCTYIKRWNISQISLKSQLFACDILYCFTS